MFSFFFKSSTSRVYFDINGIFNLHQPHFKCSVTTCGWLVATLSDSVELESCRKHHRGWLRLRRNLWASVWRWLIKAISLLSPSTLPRHIINAALVFCSPWSSCPSLYYHVPIITVISSFPVCHFLLVVSPWTDKEKMPPQLFSGCYHRNRRLWGRGCQRS